jgi:hypothetical protein
MALAGFSSASPTSPRRRCCTINSINFIAREQLQYLLRSQHAVSTSARHAGPASLDSGVQAATLTTASLMRAAYRGAQALDHLLPEQTNGAAPLFVCPDCAQCSHVQAGTQITVHRTQRPDAADGPPRCVLSASLTASLSPGRFPLIDMRRQLAHPSIVKPSTSWDHVLIVISLICAALLATSQVRKRFLVARFSLSQSRIWSGTSFARGPRAHRPCSCATEPSGVCARVCGVLRTPHATSHDAMLRHSGGRYTCHAIALSTPRLLRCIGCVSSGVRRCVEVLPTTQAA